MTYKKLKDTWASSQTIESYSGPVTLSLPEWNRYVSNGLNVLYGSGGVIPGGTIQTPGGNSGAVYRGHVRQGWGMYDPTGN